jgi:hypothetical protein
MGYYAFLLFVYTCHLAHATCHCMHGCIECHVIHSIILNAAFVLWCVDLDLHAMQFVSVCCSSDLLIVALKLPLYASNAAVLIF